MFYELAKEAFDREHLRLLEEMSERTGIPCEELIEQVLFESGERKGDILEAATKSVEGEAAEFRAFIDTL